MKTDRRSFLKGALGITLMSVVPITVQAEEKKEIVRKIIIEEEKIDDVLGDVVTALETQRYEIEELTKLIYNFAPADIRASVANKKSLYRSVSRASQLSEKLLEYNMDK